MSTNRIHITSPSLENIEGLKLWEPFVGRFKSESTYKLAIDISNILYLSREQSPLATSRTHTYTHNQHWLTTHKKQIKNLVCNVKLTLCDRVVVDNLCMYFVSFAVW